MNCQRPAGIALEAPPTPRPVPFDAHQRADSGRPRIDAVTGPGRAPVARRVEAIAPKDRLDLRRLSEAPRHPPFVRGAKQSVVLVVRSVPPRDRTGQIPVGTWNRIGLSLHPPTTHERPLVVITHPDLARERRLHVLDPIAEDEFADGHSPELH